MQAVVLAGGLGTRLRPLTNSRPKPLLPLVNRPMILHMIERLPAAIDDVVIAASHLTEQLEAFFRRVDVGRAVTVVRERKPLGTGGGLRNVADRVEGTFLAWNADVVASLAVADLVEAHRRNGGVGTIALWEVDDPSAFGVVAMEGTRITRFVEKPKKGEAPTNLANAGMYVFEPDILDAIPAGRAVSLEREVYPAVLGAGLHGHRFSGYWSDVGTPKNFLRATSMLLHNAGGEVHRDARVAARARLTPPVSIAAGSRVDGEIGPVVTIGRDCVLDGARVRDSVLFDRVEVGAGATVTASLLGEGSRVGPRATVSESVLGDGVSVPGGTEVVGKKVAS